MRTVLARFLLPCFLAFLGGCIFQSNEDIKGGGTDTENLTLSGRALDADGTPRSGSLVRLFPASYDPNLPDTALIKSARTDTHGRFTFSNLSKDSLFTLLGSGEGRQMAFADSLRPDTAIHTLTLSTARVFNISRIAGAAAAESTSIYFPGTDIMAEVGEAGASLDAIPRGLRKLGLATGKAIWRYSMASTNEADAFLEKADTLDIETKVSAMVFTPPLTWRKLASQPFDPPGSGYAITLPTSSFHLATGMESDVFATSDTGLYASTDGGATWIYRANHGDEEYVALSADSKGLVIVNRHLSLDRGETWADFNGCDDIHPCSNPITPTAVEINRMGTLLVAGPFPDTVMDIVRTLDRGKTSVETLIGKGLARTPVAFATSEQGQIYLGLARTGILASNDQGATWFSQGVLPDYDPFLANGKADLSCLQTTQDGTLYAGYTNRAGDTSSPALFRLASDLKSAEAVKGNWHNSGVTSMVRGPSGALFVGTWGRGIYRSFDGRSWIEFNRGLENGFVIALAIGPKGTLFALTRSGMLALDKAEGTTLSGK